MTTATGDETLQTYEFGEGEIPLLIVHGLFGSARNWGGIAKACAKTRRVVAVDLRNHGKSFRDPRHDYEAMAADLARVIETQGGVADILGHSMGGKATMMLALTRPEILRHVIIADIAPVAYTHSQIELVREMQALDLAQVSRRSDADRVLQVSIPEPAVRMFLLQSLVFEGGVGRWLLNLDVLEREMPEIMRFPAIDTSFRAECLFLTGAASDYVRKEHKPEIARLFPKARFEALEGAGHWLHAEKPQQFIAAVEGYLNDAG